MNNFTKSIEFTLPWEVGKNFDTGGYTCDPNDPGGETKWGISCRANPGIDIKNLALDEALKIYKNKYYDVYKDYKREPVDLDSMPLSLAVAVFDTGVNCGVNRCYGWLLTALKEKAPVDKLLELRKEHYLKLPTYNIYGRGWIRRLNDLRKVCEIYSAEIV